MSVHRLPRSAGSTVVGTATPAVGVAEWFVVGERARAQRVASNLNELGVRHLRTGLSWADWHATGGRAWYRWLLPRLARDFDVLPCITFTPPSLGVEHNTAAPPRRLRDYADFVDLMLTEFGDLFEYVELWNEPNNLSDWDWRIDTNWAMFGEMVGAAATWARRRTKKVVLAGPSPLDPAWLDIVGRLGVLDCVDAVGLHAFPGTWEPHWNGWDEATADTREVLQAYGSNAELWITETGFSTWRHDEHSQLRELAAALDAPVERVYWYAAEDLAPDRRTLDGSHADERDYHFGIHRADGVPKLLGRAWADGGIAHVRRLARLAREPRARRYRGRHALVTGGAGFVGTNVADRLLREGKRVLVLDNLSRSGVERNLMWLRETHGEENVAVDVADVRDPYALRRALDNADEVFHFAAQVAVTTSVADPDHDFGANLVGTFNLLEELRRLSEPPPLLFTSTNKVYGALADVDVVRDGERWEPAESRLRDRGVDERRPLDFCTPYGCSKGGADQYVLDYAKSFDLPATVFRMSCIYGPHQHGTEDQGWVAHFVLRALDREPIVIYGDGAQVRDVLYATDLVDAMLLAVGDIENAAGLAFNVGGGRANSASLLEVVQLIGEILGDEPRLEFADERLGDQRWYVSDTSRFHAVTGWAPRIGVADGVERLVEWVRARRGAVERPAARAVR